MRCVFDGGGSFKLPQYMIISARSQMHSFLVDLLHAITKGVSMRKRYKAILIILMLAALLISEIQAADSVIIYNEIMYHPHADADIEWTELHNIFDIDTCINHWFFHR